MCIRDSCSSVRNRLPIRRPLTWQTVWLALLLRSVSRCGRTIDEIELGFYIEKHLATRMRIRRPWQRGQTLEQLVGNLASWYPPTLRFRSPLLEEGNADTTLCGHCHHVLKLVAPFLWSNNK